MDFFLYISNYLVPLMILYVVMYGLAEKVKVYDVFVEGAKGGLKVVTEICPVLIGLMVATGLLRESGALEALSEALSPFFEKLGFPIEIVPLVMVKMFSSSAATGFLLDIYKEYGVDSFLGNVGSVCLASSETIFYTMTIYFASVKITKTRWTFAGAFFSTLVGTVFSVIMVNVIMG